MERRNMIMDIEALYPADTDYVKTAEIGQRLLQEAMNNMRFTWRDMPDHVLEEYRRLCVMQEFIESRKSTF